MTDIKTVKQNVIYKGYNQYSIYDLQIPSFNKTKQNIPIKNHEILETRDAVHVLIYAHEIDSFVFCQQFRCGPFFNKNNDNPFLLECVAGTIEQGDSAENTVRREVEEETGLTINEIKHILSGYSSPGIMSEKAHLYFALVKGTPQSVIAGQDNEGEEILTHIIDRRTVYELLDNNQLIDCKTLLALYWYRCHHP